MSGTIDRTPTAVGILAGFLIVVALGFIGSLIVSFAVYGIADWIAPVR